MAEQQKPSHGCEDAMSRMRCRPPAGASLATASPGFPPRLTALSGPSPEQPSGSFRGHHGEAAKRRRHRRPVRECRAKGATRMGYAKT